MNDHRVRLKQHYCPAMDATPYRVDVERVISGMYPLSIAIIAYSMFDSKIFQGFETWLSLDHLSVFKMSFFVKINEVIIRPIALSLITSCACALTFFDGVF